MDIAPAKPVKKTTTSDRTLKTSHVKAKHNDILGSLTNIIELIPDELRIIDLLRPITKSGEARMRDLGLRTRALRKLWDAWEALHVIDNGHEVLLIDKNAASIKPERVPHAEWLLADSCELSSLEEAALDRCDVVIAATGDDKVNLVTSLLAKTEFGVPRTVGRVNHPDNEWLFTEAWGVDVNVSTPRIMSALVEEAVTVGDLVRLFTFRQGNANLVEMTLPADSPYVGKPAGLVPFPDNCALVSILRDGQVYVPDAEQPIESGDELLFVVPEDREDELEALLAPTEHGRG